VPFFLVIHGAELESALRLKDIDEAHDKKDLAG